MHARTVMLALWLRTEPPIGVLHGLQPPRIGAPVTQSSAMRSYLSRSPPSSALAARLMYSWALLRAAASCLTIMKTPGLQRLSDAMLDSGAI
jgi:hypothetical protein